MLDSRDVVAIHQLLSFYGHAADALINGQADRLDEVFTQHAVFDATASNRKIHYGLEEIRELFHRVSPPHPPSHHVSNPYVWEEDGQVRALSKWIGVDPGTGGFRSGDYQDVLVRTDDGWRICKRTVMCRWWDGPPSPTS